MEATISKNEAAWYILLAVVGILVASAIGSVIPILYEDIILLPLGRFLIFAALAMKHLSQADDVRYCNDPDCQIAYILSILSLASLIIFLKSGILFLIRVVF